MVPGPILSLSLCKKRAGPLAMVSTVSDIPFEKRKPRLAENNIMVNYRTVTFLSSW
jgi:hypothetical protein